MAFDQQDVDLSVNPAVAKLKPGKVTIGIRPRAFTVVAEDTGDTIDAMAELIEPMGAETLIHARTKTGNDIRVVVRARQEGEDRRGAPSRARSRANPCLR